MSATSRWTSACLSDRELSACVGPGTFIPPHVIECADCRGRRAQLVADAAVIRGYTVEAPSAEALASLRAEVLRATHQPAPRARPALARWAAAAAALLVIGGAGAAWWVTREVEAPPRWARIEDGAEARYQHEVVRLGDHGVVDEVVRLERGQIRVRVEQLTASQRFRVVALGGDEVEVRGTTFDVAVDDGRLAMVAVLEGLVAVRRVGQPVVWLESGDTWRGERGTSARTRTSSGAGAATEAAANGDETKADGDETKADGDETRASDSTAPGSRREVPATSGARAHDPTRGASVAGASDHHARLAPRTGRPLTPQTARSPMATTPDARAGADVEDSEVAETSSTAVTAPPVAAAPVPPPDAGSVTPDIPARTDPPPSPRAAEPSHVTVDLEAAEAQFGWGWDALRERDYVSAARYFGQAELLAGADALAEDAAYWRAMALHDARHAALDRALELYVVRYPSAPRWATVALLRAERLLAAGRQAEARPLLTRVAQDPDYVRARRAKELLSELR
jgi:hypothetical protein